MLLKPVYTSEQVLKDAKKKEALSGNRDEEAWLLSKLSLHHTRQYERQCSSCRRNVASMGNYSLQATVPGWFQTKTQES